MPPLPPSAPKLPPAPPPLVPGGVPAVHAASLNFGPLVPPRLLAPFNTPAIVTDPLVARRIKAREPVTLIVVPAAIVIESPAITQSAVPLTSVEHAGSFVVL